MAPVRSDAQVSQPEVGAAAEAILAVERLLRWVGEDPDREGLFKTPARVIRSLREMTSGYREDPAAILTTVFGDRSDEMVVVHGVEFWSLCEHHLLPFHGTAVVGYLPNGRVVGLSKLARLVHCFARRLQVQERLTQQVAEAMMDHLQPLGVGVVLRANHLCMAARGVRSPSTTVTSALLGVMREPSPRAEFLALANGG